MYQRQRTLDFLTILRKLRFLRELTFKIWYSREPKLARPFVVSMALGNIELVLGLFKA